MVPFPDEKDVFRVLRPFLNLGDTGLLEEFVDLTGGPLSENCGDFLFAVENDCFVLSSFENIASLRFDFLNAGDPWSSSAENDGSIFPLDL